MIYIFDGAMGTMLQQAGLAPGCCPELWNAKHPEKITAIHCQYIEAGTNIIETNTFGANRIKLQHYGLASQVDTLNRAAVQAARDAAGDRVQIAGSVGPTGKFIDPLGDLGFDEAHQVFLEQITALDAAGVDMILIETIIDIQEMRAALLAAKQATAKPVLCQLSFNADGRTVTGTDAQTAAITLEALGADIIGANCSLGPAQLLPVIEQLAKNTRCPISVQPNAGMPQLIHGQTVFPMQPAELAAWVPRLIAAGASYIGGCCGTTPAHIRAITTAAKGLSPASRPARPEKAVMLTSRSRTVIIGAGLPTAIIGERINPSGRKAMAESIRNEDFTPVKKEALAQVAAGAGILDVNMGVPGIQQAFAMSKAVAELSMLVDVPLAIDTTDPEALEAGLKIFPGRALVNSVSAEPERLAQFLPLARKYGAAVLCLPIAPGGVPYKASERVAIAQQIVDAALAAGLTPEDLMLDPLVLTVAADAAAAQETLTTLRLYRERFGFPTAMGLSNISYGLPRRDLMNSIFLAMAVTSGLDAPILNPYDPMMKDSFSAACALQGHDSNGAAYSTLFAGANTRMADAAAPEDTLARIRRTVFTGGKETVIPLVKQALAEGWDPLAVTEQGFTQAMNELGDEFGAGRCFLPQLMLAAETMRIGFSTLKEVIPAHKTDSMGTIVLATVKGDIHDLGKNIVAALLENSGFTVIDLGKDISAEQVIAAWQEYRPDIIGLCSLMTTTLPQIDNTIKKLRQSGATPRVMVGGAVLTPEYAKTAGADAYAADAVEAVKLAKAYIEEKKHPL
jgi:5-methyltetrahydrofolate--homocysteine methyltransferase